MTLEEIAERKRIEREFYTLYADKKALDEILTPSIAPHNIAMMLRAKFFAFFV